MKTVEKLKIIREIKGLTQTELARFLGVSFQTLNSWINEKSKPYPNHIQKIDAILTRETGQTSSLATELDLKKEYLKRKGKTLKIPNIFEPRPDLIDEFVLRLTYNSNSIEGSSLSLEETRDILFEGRVPPNKKTVEIIEAKNHEQALRYLLDKKLFDKKITEKEILNLHKILMTGIIPNAGLYRHHNVRILGSFVPTANYLKIPNLMKKFIKDINKKEKDTISLVAHTHAQFEQIHPFSDGNGRTGRLIANIILFKYKLPPMIIQTKKKNEYYKALAQAQLEEEFYNLENTVCQGMIEGVKMID